MDLPYPWKIGIFHSYVSLPEGIDKTFPSGAIPQFQKKHIGRRYVASCRYGTLAIVTVDDGGVGFVGPKPSKTNWFQVDELQKNTSSNIDIGNIILWQTNIAMKNDHLEVR